MCSGECKILGLFVRYLLILFLNTKYTCKRQLMQSTLRSRINTRPLPTRLFFTPPPTYDILHKFPTPLLIRSPPFIRDLRVVPRFNVFVTTLSEAAICRCSSKGVLKHFTIFTGKHLCRSLFSTKLQG